MLVFSRLSPAVPTEVYDTYWRFAAERQEIFFKRLARKESPWTEDPILREYKFTNAYRASDRVSQFLIRHVIYSGNIEPSEVFFRTILFKLFNKIETWRFLEAKVGLISYHDFDFNTYDALLTTALESGQRIYSSAYIMPTRARGFGMTEPRKHRTHLRILELMMRDRAWLRIANAETFHEAFDVLRSYPLLGDFLAYQFVTDLNYSELIDFPEREFVVPGPGAKDGLRKCFSTTGGLSETEAIRMVADRQQEEFEKRGLHFRDLWGRALQLIDCQNIFCEVDKYARVKHPDARGLSGRKRIKRRFSPHQDALDIWYPPKWGLNERIRKAALH
jgi:hypothetical protein